jgi:hypothetical protein
MESMNGESRNVARPLVVLESGPLWLQYTAIILSVLSFLATIIFGVNAWQTRDERDRFVDFPHAAEATNLTDFVGLVLDQGNGIEAREIQDLYSDEWLKGTGKVQNVGSWGEDGFLLDFTTAGSLFTCNLKGDAELKRKLLTANGKNIVVVGRFKNMQVVGHGLLLEDCEYSFQ